MAKRRPWLAWGATLFVALASAPVAIWCFATGFALGTGSHAGSAWTYLVTLAPVGLWLVLVWLSGRLHKGRDLLIHWTVMLSIPLLFYLAVRFWPIASQTL